MNSGNHHHMIQQRVRYPSHNNLQQEQYNRHRVRNQVVAFGLLFLFSCCCCCMTTTKFLAMAFTPAVVTTTKISRSSSTTMSRGIIRTISTTTSYKTINKYRGQQQQQQTPQSVLFYSMVNHRTSYNGAAIDFCTTSGCRRTYYNMIHTNQRKEINQNKYNHKNTPFFFSTTKTTTTPTSLSLLPNQGMDDSSDTSSILIDSNNIDDDEEEEEDDDDDGDTVTTSNNTIKKQSNVFANVSPVLNKKKQVRRMEPITLELPKIILKRTKQSRAFRDGNQLVFTKAIQDIIPLNEKDEQQQPSAYSQTQQQTQQSKPNVGKDSKYRSSKTGASTTGPTLNFALVEQGALVEICVELEQTKDTKTNNKNNTMNSNKINSNPLYQTIGLGVYNAASLYKVRILVHQYPQPNEFYENVIRKCHDPINALHDIVQHNIRNAVQLRTALGLGGGTSTTRSTNQGIKTDTYRLINGEGDTLSGLSVDMIGDHVIVVMSSAAWCEKNREMITQILIEEVGNNNSGGGDDDDNNSPVVEVIWKTAPSRLQQDGYIQSNNSVNQDEDDETTLISPSEEVSSPKMVLSKENGLYFATYPYETGQKTGVYCDQRENRLYISQYCTNQRVLDLCCYHGGFSIASAFLGHAKSVIGVDSSSVAITIAQENAQRNLDNYLRQFGTDNGIQPTLPQFVQADVTNYLQQQYQIGQFHDVIILDPPKLAPSAALLEKARRKYHALNRDAIRVIDETQGGWLLSCTCSAAMTEMEGGKYFLNMVHQAGLAAGRHVTLVQVRNAAPCHTIAPSCSPTGSYLTAALFFIQPKK